MRVSPSGKAVLGVLIHCPSGYLRALWFNQPFMREKFSFGQKVVVSGKPKYEGLVWQMHHPRVETLAEDEDEPVGKILPVYSLTEGLQQWQLRKIVRAALDTYAELLDEVFPAEYLEAHKLLPIKQALPQIHFPADQASLEQSRRRFVYQETVRVATGFGDKKAADARPATFARVGGHGADRRSDSATVSF